MFSTILINGREKVGTRKIKNPKAFIEYSETIDDAYDTLEDYNPKKKLFIVFDDMITDRVVNEKIKSYSHRIILKRTRPQHSTCFYIIILFHIV